MSHFYAEVDGSARTTGTRCGTKKSGISGHIRGWDSGVSIEGVHNSISDRDVFKVYATSGSNGGPSQLIAIVYKDENGKLVVNSMIEEGAPTIESL